MAQQGPPPRRPGRHSAPAPEAGQYGADPLGPDERDPRPPGADPYAADPYPADPYPADPYADPYEADPYAPRDDPYGTDPLGTDPLGGDSRNGDSRNGDPRGAEPYRGRRAAPERPEPSRPPVGATAVRPAAGPGRVSPWGQDDPFAGDDDEGDLPPWAGLTIRPARAGGTRTRPARPEPGDGAEDGAEDGAGEAAPAPAPRRRGLGRGRARATQLRKSRRRVWVYCGLAVILAVAVAAVLAIRALPRHNAAPTFITTLQPGEFARVPSACGSVGKDLLATYLPGQVTTVNPGGTSASYSQCTLTVDRRPMFRVLGVTAQAYQPSAVAAGNGSATDNATDAFVLAEQALRAPGKKSALPAAQITPVTRLGRGAFSAVQVIHASGAVNDLVTVMARQRNLVITVTFQAQTAGNGYGPANISFLQAGALATARAVLHQDTARGAAG